VLAESDDTVVVEATTTSRGSRCATTCWSKRPGRASARGRARRATPSSSTTGTNADAAWFYPEPKAEAEQIRDRVAFWKGEAMRPPGPPAATDAAVACAR